jgi:23S rRNA pseudouridine1911/1915/1917 synthase
MIPEILYEDNHLIAVSKRPSDLSQGDKTGDIALDTEIKKYLAKKYNKPGEVFLGIIHRLDRPVGGVLLFARTSKALSRMNAIFRSREVTKTYLAIVNERPPDDEAELIHYLKKNEKQNKTYAFDNEIKGSQLASLSYKLLGRSERFFLLEIKLHSGRHHQIRAQLAKINCPIKGDLKYGFPRSNANGSISLFARKLEFIHPVSGKKISIVAGLPKEDVWSLFRDTIE